MHTYRTASSRDGKTGWQVGSNVGANSFDAVGPICEKESEAAALASYLNGGDYDPSAIAAVYKPSEEAREKARKAQEDTAKREEAAEQARIKREQEAAAAAANPPKPEPKPDEPAPPPPHEEKPKARAHASRAKQHVKTAKLRRHK